LRRGALSLADTVAQSITVMAPAMSGGFITYLAATKAGGATSLSFVFATVACLFIGGVVAQFTLGLRSAGSLYTYTTHGLGAFWGYLTGWAYAAGFWVAGPAVLAGSGVFVSMAMRDFGAPGIFCQWWLWFGLGLVAWFSLSFFGVQLSTRSSLAFVSFAIAVLVAIALIIVVKGGAQGNTVQAFNPAGAGVSWPAVIAGMAFGLLSFTGFETAANLGEETRHPRRNIPLAIFGAVAIGGAFYVLVTYATAIGYGVHAATTQWPKSTSGLAPVATKYAGGLSDLFLIVVAVDAFFCGLGISNVVTRMLFSMARDGVAPKVLAKTHRTYRSPYVALVTYLVGCVAIAVFVIGITTPGTRDAVAGGGGHLAAGLYLFSEGLTVVTPPIMIGYLLLSIAGIAYGLRLGKTGFVITAAVSTVISGMAVGGSLYYSFVPSSPGAAIPMPYVVIPWLVLGWLCLACATAAWLRKARPGTWSRIGTIFE
ncbi:MAG TPA: APC family permease, partial [Acidimicrobiales bacterium]|nr:APC family permease [Acidimicrobiales bacterium]